VSQDTQVRDARYGDVAWLLIAIASAIQVARVLGMTAAHGELPFLSANDRSRWSAMAALTEDGKWEIDRVIEILDSKGKSKIWNTIDMVRHQGAYGSEHFYSSKPPLLTAMYALVCKPVCMITGKKLTEEPFLIGRIVLLIVNVLPLILWWIWLHRWLERNVVDGWSRFMLLNMALWGTFLSTFAATLNNHLHGALFFTLSLILFWQIAQAAKKKQSVSWTVWLSCGLFAGLTVACELPALAWAAALGAMLFTIDVRKMLFGYGVGTLVVAIAFLGTNYWAHLDWRTPYSHRGVGAKIASIPKADGAKDPDIASVIEQVNRSGKGYQLTDQAKLTKARLPNVQQLIDESVGQRVAIQESDKNWDVYQWDDWYDFPKSYWLPGNRKGVDMGEPSPAWYIFHFTIGHHGIFSLTPFWILSGIGGALWIVRRSKGEGTLVARLRAFTISDAGLACALLAVTAACFVFYSTRPLEDRNYAGVCSGFRWVFWLVPAWLWLSVPAVELASRKTWSRRIVSLALLVSVFSATIPWPNPWSHPWPYRVAIWLVPEKVETK
jgi:hypothetical protein